MKQLTEGVQAPDFELQTLDGRVFRLSTGLLSGPLVLVFYKGSCPTCQFTFPYLQRIHSENGSGSGPRMWAISQDEPAETQLFKERFGVGFDILLDEHPFEVSMAYGLEFVPGIFIIGQDGIIRRSDYGFSKAALQEIASLGAAPLTMFSANDGIPATKPG